MPTASADDEYDDAAADADRGDHIVTDENSLPTDRFPIWTFHKPCMMHDCSPWLDCSLLLLLLLLSHTATISIDGEYDDAAADADRGDHIVTEHAIESAPRSYWKRCPPDLFLMCALCIYR